MHPANLKNKTNKHMNDFRNEQINTPTRWRTINGQVVPIYESPAPDLEEENNLISAVVLGFVVFSFGVGLARCLLTIHPIAAALAAIAFLGITEANLIYLKHRMGRWNSRAQELAGFSLAAVLFVASAMNLSSFLIEMLQVKDFLSLERFWFVIVQPIVSALAMLGSLYISVAMDPFRKVETIRRDALTQERLLQVEDDFAAKTAASRRKRFAVENAPRFEALKQQRVIEMLSDGTLQREVEWAARQAARDVFEIAELGAIAGTVLSTGDGAEPKVTPTPSKDNDEENAEDSVSDKFFTEAKPDGEIVVQSGGKQVVVVQKLMKMTDEEREEAVKAHIERGQSLAQVAGTYNVSRQYIGQLVQAFKAKTLSTPDETSDESLVFAEKQQF